MMDFVIEKPKPKLVSTNRGVGFSRSMSFLNRTGTGIKVSFANGHCVTIPPVNSTVVDGVFYVTVEYDIRNGCSLQELEKSISEAEYKVLVGGLTTNRSNPVLEYELKPIDTLSSGKAIYLDELNVTLSSSAVAGFVYPTNLDKAATAMGDGHDKNFELYIMSVDSLGLKTGEFVRYGEFVFELNHTPATGLPDGIYIATRCNGEELIVNRYELDAEIRGFKMFRSRRDAMEYNFELSDDQIAIEKARLAQSKIELEKELVTAKQKLSDMTLENSQRERDLNAHYEREKRKIEREAMERKDEYEYRSQLRKDSSESIKWLPSIIAALGAAVTIFSKV